MVDRIDKLDPKLFQVQEAMDEEEQRHSQDQEESQKKEKEKDKFDKGGQTWKKIVTDPRIKSPTEKRTIWGEREEVIPPPAKGPAQGKEQNRSGGEPEEVSLSLSQRVLVAWGILDLRGKPRVPVIVTYTAVGLVITFSAFLILRILWGILWR